MPTPDLSRARWRKSSISNASGECVEMAHVDDVTAFRDSKNPTGPVLAFTGVEGAAFITAAKRGRFDRA